MSGMGTVIRGAFPPFITVVACLPLLALRESAATQMEFGNGLRATGGVAIVLTLVGGWIRQRDAIRAWFRTASHEAAKKSSSSTTSTSSSSTTSTSSSSTSSTHSEGTPT
jgi:hypothetical protein